MARGKTSEAILKDRVVGLRAYGCVYEAKD